MADIVSIDGHRLALTDEGTVRFLLDEGLDLLAAYRAIESPGIRLALLHAIKAMAATNRMLPPDPSVSPE